MNRVKELRAERQMKQVDLIKLLDISQATLSNWERGVHNPDNKSLARLAKIFGCSIDYLLAQSELRNTLDLDLSSTDQAYFLVVSNAKKFGIPPRDLQLAVDFLRKANERDGALA